jgi:hypothetical protein
MIISSFGIFAEYKQKCQGEPDLRNAANEETEDSQERKRIAVWLANYPLKKFVFWK